MFVCDQHRINQFVSYVSYVIDQSGIFVCELHQINQLVDYWFSKLGMILFDDYSNYKLMFPFEEEYLKKSRKISYTLQRKKSD